MKCSKCGGEIKNLPDYIEETNTEVLCSKCAGTENKGTTTSPIYNRYRYYKSYAGVTEEIDIAA